ncbi:zinc finger protein 280A-like [Bicyclus anynana]|uniref:Zinc finger protein 280A-like n=1 Tax=Bicyclus anynana TaxID=110368 RepID=A0ABM3LFN9_BICAN|nr:zinc finger protein 280A-like [Bicyclus anynana]
MQAAAATPLLRRAATAPHRVASPLGSKSTVHLVHWAYLRGHPKPQLNNNHETELLKSIFVLPVTSGRTLDIKDKIDIKAERSKRVSVPTLGAQYRIYSDDNLPKAICHDCLQQVSILHLYTVKVDKTQKFLEFHNIKSNAINTERHKLHPIIAAIPKHKENDIKSNDNSKQTSPKVKVPPTDFQQGDANTLKLQKRKSPADMRFLEVMPLDEFAITESIDKSLLNSTASSNKPSQLKEKDIKENADVQSNDVLDPIVLVDGRPAKQGAALDKQITLFYKMECCICHKQDFHFRSLMKHYKDRHGVPGYVTCCEKKFHYFYPKKIIEHMAYHLQPNIFMCRSCHQNFQTSQQLLEHQSNGGMSEGKIACPRCTDRYPTYQELGWHIVTHRSDKLQCDYCGKLLKHHHRKKTVNHMEDVILCSHCVRTLKSLEKQEREIKEKVKAKSNDVVTIQKYQKFRQAMGLSADEDGSTD